MAFAKRGAQAGDFDQDTHISRAPRKQIKAGSEPCCWIPIGRSTVLILRANKSTVHRRLSLLAILDIGTLFESVLKDLLTSLPSHYHFQFGEVFPHTSDHSVVMKTSANAFINLHQFAEPAEKLR